ncbi:hypothetical protein AALP_AA3G112200 [Arabis alpina]|uniref:DNA-directed DNA polymerase family B exonuclease domain-containing protein n=1 Tax=Arabis alpina TaxID=50452 RepID=A0A087H8H9_ARAAL|nr:hypothetical protein AALP_AA3G112200 [Arabis alpina]
MNKEGNSKKPPSTSCNFPAEKHQVTGNHTPSPVYLVDDVLIDETLRVEESLRFSKWTRPKLSHDYLSQSKSIIFQQLEIDYVNGESPSLQAPIIRIFGVTKEGHSVCCLVHGFEPYLYIACPPGIGPDNVYRLHQFLESLSLVSLRNWIPISKERPRRAIRAFISAFTMVRATVLKVGDLSGEELEFAPRSDVPCPKFTQLIYKDSFLQYAVPVSCSFWNALS